MSNPSVHDLYDAFEDFRGHSLNPEQKEAVEADESATWVLAGPGTGKTETLVVRVLRLLLIEEEPPESIFLTTFTNRAAQNLEDRVSKYLDRTLEHDEFSEVAKPNVSSVWIGTLHHLAKDILDQMGPETTEIQVLDEEAALFRFLQELNSGTIRNEQLYKALNGTEVPPYRKFDRIHFAEHLKTAVDRVVEDDLDRDALESDSPLHGESEWIDQRQREEFVDVLADYEVALGRLTDFSRIQSRFLEFLRSDRSDPLLSSDEDQELPGIRHVIVDEYQDTNPIQENVYIELARGAKSFVVVGDDDQALYRFRGASVESMVNFDEVVREELGGSPGDDLSVTNLVKNYRSRGGLVDSLNSYISAVESETTYGRARTSKAELEDEAELQGDFPAIQLVVGDDESALAAAVAESIAGLEETGSITDSRQAAILSYSTKVTSRSTFRQYTSALSEREIDYFNPGAKNIHEDQTLEAVLGLISKIIDPNDDVLRVQARHIKEYVGYDGTESGTLRASAEQLLQRSPQLRQWTRQTVERIDQTAGAGDGSYPSGWNFLSVFYGIINRPPIADYLDSEGGPQEAVEAWRLGWLSGMLASFQQNLPGGGRLFQAEDDDWTRGFYQFRDEPVPDEIRGVSPNVVDRFYRDYIAVFQRGGFDEVEDEIDSLPPGRVPALTIHQSKGLEFPAVYVVANQPVTGPGYEHHQEELFHPYRKKPSRNIQRFSAHERSVHDAIRRFFVAISRAKSMCVVTLERDVYDALLEGDSDVAEAYPYLPRQWIEQLPTTILD